MPGRFADSNVLLYLADRNEKHRAIAVDLLDQGLTISVQVLNDMASVMLGKWRRSWDETHELLSLVRTSSKVCAIDEITHDLGIEIAESNRIGIYDSMIVAAALISGCHTLYSEDMHHGLRIGGLTIVNPFAA